MNQENNEVNENLQNQNQNQALSQETQEEKITDLAFYNKELSKKLPKLIFKNTPERLIYLFSYLLVNALLINFVKGSNSVILNILCGIAIGVLNGGLAFMAHELLHGAILKSQKLQNFFGYIGFAPFLISPTFWRYWHNRLHHGKTQNLIHDPDCFPTLAVYRRSKFMKWAFKYTPGSGYIRSYLYFGFWFMFQAFINQAYFRFGNKQFATLNQKKVTLEFAGMLVLMLAYIAFIGVNNWFYLLVIPYMAQNYTVMSYISTNHNLSPQTKYNDPLANSLTVTNNPIFEFIHLNFGYHTEHHIFPSMSGQYLKVVHEELKKSYPDKFKIMPKSEALKLLYQSSRIYKNRDTLIHPETHAEFKTLGT